LKNFGSKLNFIFLFVVVLILLFGNDSYSIDQGKEVSIDSGDTAWMIVSCAFVLLMTPGLAFFYGGMVNIKNIISTMLQSFVALGVISIVWVLIGFSLAFGDSFYGIIGSPLTYFNFQNVTLAPHPDFGSTIPFLLFAFFQLKFAIITPAIISGSFAERIRFRSYILFMLLFTIFIYSPLAHMTWHPDGIFRKWGVLDFAGGAVVHISAGFASLAGAIYLGKRKYNHLKSYNTSYVLLGTGMLWFGWFGFNSGSALGANQDAILAFMTTNTASAMCMITWLVMEGIKGHKIKVIDACIGAVVGLVIITPAAGFVNLSQSIFMGAFGGIICNLFLSFFKRFDIDDSLDVFACHGMGGIIGLLFTGIFAKDVGLFYGETTTFFNHIYALIIISVFTFFGSLLIYNITALIIPIRVSNEIEEKGLDFSIHGESIN